MSHRPFHLLQGPLRTPDGWTLLLRRASRGGRPGDGPPILLVPGYGMNASIFAFHPEGHGLLEHLLGAGFDPWAIDLRGTSTSAPPLRGAPARLRDQAWIDLPTALERVAHVTRQERVHAIGCSLGGALLYAHVGRDAHRVDRLVTMGSPLAWSDRSLPVEAFSR
ncbi:MAG TPA: alpha/beta fold hydrolase, partial [Myxococcota bacterium]|nr:alpha/beta fold hydrolase [Myxococcota bacterium]